MRPVLFSWLFGQVLNAKKISSLQNLSLKIFAHFSFDVLIKCALLKMSVFIVEYQPCLAMF